MVVSGRNHDQIALEGAAYFDVPHDPARELVIRVGDYAVRDIGTRFEVFGAGRALKVAVAEGNVTVALPGGRETRVVEGQRLIVSGEPAVAEYASIAADDVAGWRSGRLVFRNEPLSLVAGQISPHAGVTVAVDPAIAGRRFSGVLAIGDGSQLVARLGEIMGLAVLPRGDAVQLSAMGAGR
jgi:transmembrane sensor